MFSRSGLITAFLLVLMLGALSAFVESRVQHPHPGKLSVERLPAQIGDWKGEDVSELPITSRETLRLDNYARRLYKNSAGDSVFLYVGYWKQQTGEYQAAKHSPSLCLPANGWKIERLGTTAVDAKATANRVVAQLNQTKMLVYYYFFSGTDYYFEEWQSLLRIASQAIFGKRTDGGIVEMSASMNSNDPAEAEAKIRAFAAELQPKLDALILEAEQM